MIVVKPLNIDDSPKYTYRTRVAKIKISSSVSIETPIRAITNSEMNAKKTIPTPVEINAEIGGVILKFTDKRTRNIKDFISKNKKFNDIKKVVISHLVTMQYFNLRYVLLQPTSSALNYLHTSDSILEKFIRLQCILQKDIEEYNLNIITIPWLNLPIEKFKQVHKKYVESNPNKTIMPVIDPGCDENLLNDILEYVISCEDNDTLNLIGILYKSFRNYRVSYDTIWNSLYDKNIGIVMLDVKRSLSSLYNVSGVHYGEFVVGDILSSYVGVGGPIQKTVNPKPIGQELKLFRKRLLDVTSLSNEIISNPKWVDDIILETNEKSIKNPLLNYQEAEHDKNKKQYFMQY
ncbi:hypothetical protein [Methanothermococcus okinawensis]|uniref:Uncharacterized protein n=1 Tax=Methanothermococcus okinawensis (strain DSM 14208 / JCM 11175 / IH1) TaxID=647113 RepID=F8AKY0_METOI|nr:hypothetical protein [Methanothermococcus okinawensis]AEH06286.1 hypothetical protein Metok_0296 [Methanothermococcus okinawensis IH1]